MTALICLRRLALGGGLAAILGALAGPAAATVAEDPGSSCSWRLPPPPGCSPLVKVGRDGRTRGAIAAAAALGQLGIPFSWGGGSSSGPTRGIGRGAVTVGFDCSGLTLYAWSRAGVRLGHYTGAQFRQGRRVSLAALRQGDLLFFGGGAGDPTHVGLYLHSGVMVHAPKTGDVVRTAQFLNSPYYRAVFRGAVRPG
ncbi:C40 family peptidase [Nonomuraea sp. LPB2021202275-12-8]|uniref:C40 family peptidase n=1 Tax=Nonomuraea sp. LPB2021202275-12-8 TaxID=3120159 RepID=UPI00300C30CD